MEKRIEYISIKGKRFGNLALKPNKNNLKGVYQPNYKPKKHKVAIMYRLKTKIVSWGIGMLSSIPEELVWDFVSKTMDRIQTKTHKLPNWAKTTFALLDLIIDSVNPNSEQGYVISKNELKEIIDRFWEETKSV